MRLNGIAILVELFMLQILRQLFQILTAVIDEIMLRQIFSDPGQVGRLLWVPVGRGIIATRDGERIAERLLRVRDYQGGANARYNDLGNLPMAI